MIFISIMTAALLLDLLTGDPPNRLHPVAWIGKWIGFLWKKRPAGPEKGENSTLKQNRKLFLWGIFITISGIICSIPLVFLNMLPEIISILISILVLKLSFSLKNLFKAAGEIRKKLDEGDLREARHLTSWHLVSRDTAALTDSEVAAAVIESTTENITDSFTSPMFFYLTLGIPGAWAYRYINTCDAMTGYRTGDYEWGGKFTAILDDIINFIPARITALFIILAGIGKNNFFRVLKETQKNRGKTDSPNAGWTMAAIAVLLGIRLEKKGNYVINPEGRDPGADDIGICVRICLTASVLIMLFLIFTGLAIYGA